MRNTMRAMLLLTACLLGAGRASAEEDPKPLWDPIDWDNVRAANRATNKHLSLFFHARDARKYCPADDRVVFLDRRYGRYYTADRPEYRLQSRGYFVCERQARRMGATEAPLR